MEQFIPIVDAHSSMENTLEKEKRRSDIKRMIEYQKPFHADVVQWREQHPCNLKLYRAEAKYNDENGPVEWLWYVAGRDEPFPFPYESLIYGYVANTEDPNKEYIDECFTESEIDQFRKYLLNEDTPFYSFHINEVKLPVTGHRSLTSEVGKSGDMILRVHKFEGYPLSFKVEGIAWRM